MENSLSLHDIYVVEGFDMAGKSTFMKKNLPYHSVYHATHDLTDITVGRQNSWVIGYGVLDFLQQTHKLDEIVIDRGVFSSYVYERLYNNRRFDARVLDFYKNSKFFTEEVGHIYVRHRNAETAEEIFNRSQSREKNPNELSAKYDQFNSFEEYWRIYTIADSLFTEAYKLVGVKPQVYETVPDGDWILAD